MVPREDVADSCRVAATIILAIVVLGALNAFGQRPKTSTSAAAPASLEVYAPTRARAGLYYMARFTIRAREDVEKATLVLDPGWAEAITINTIEPSPIGEGSEDGRIVLARGYGVLESVPHSCLCLDTGGMETKHFGDAHIIHRGKL